MNQSCSESIGSLNYVSFFQNVYKLLQLLIQKCIEVNPRDLDKKNDY